MAKKLSITVDDDVYDFIEAVGGDNRSKFITELIRERQQLELEKELAQQLLEDAADSETSSEGKLWETATLLDGLEDWEDDWDDSKAPRNLVG
jgi:predicted CopG family antitoxin